MSTTAFQPTSFKMDNGGINQYRQELDATGTINFRTSPEEIAKEKKILQYFLIKYKTFSKFYDPENKPRRSYKKRQSDDDDDEPVAIQRVKGEYSNTQWDKKYCEE